VIKPSESLVNKKAVAIFGGRITDREYDENLLWKEMVCLLDNVFKPDGGYAVIEKQLFVKRLYKVIEENKEDGHLYGISYRAVNKAVEIVLPFGWWGRRGKDFTDLSNEYLLPVAMQFERTE